MFINTSCHFYYLNNLNKWTNLYINICNKMYKKIIKIIIHKLDDKNMFMKLGLNAQLNLGDSNIYYFVHYI